MLELLHLNLDSSSPNAPKLSFSATSMYSLNDFSRALVSQAQVPDHEVL